MKDVLTTIRYCSSILGDQQDSRAFRVFTKDFLKSALDEAIAVIASSLPELLAHDAAITLVAGAKQPTACPNGTVVMEGNGAVEKQIDGFDSTASIMFGGCDTAAGYTPTSFANATTRMSIMVSPPVPDGMAGTVLNVTCHGAMKAGFDYTDDAGDLSWLPPDAEQIINDWILYRSFLIDDGDIHTNAEADRIYQRLTRRLGDEYTMQLRDKQPR